MAVLIGHALPTLLPGGYLGVDIFFVISGYLITGMIMNDTAHQRFSFQRFYRKRAYRLLPAFLFVFVITVVTAAFLQSSGEYIATALTSITSLIGVSNIYLATAHDYFSPEASLNPFMHTWSLGVEEQFYILYPAIVLLCLRYGRERFLFTLLAIGVTTSLIHATHLHSIGSPWAHFSPLARIWQLGSGALLCLYHLRTSDKTRVAAAEMIAGTALFAIILIAALGPTPMIGAVAVVLSAAALIHLGRVPMKSLRILTIAPAVSLGLMSYSLYLWHQPVMSLSRMLVNDGTIRFGLVTISLSILFAYPTWLYIEMPMRRVRIPALYALSGLMALMFLLCVVVLSITTMKSRNEAEILRHIEVSYDLEREVRSCGVDHRLAESYTPCRYAADPMTPYKGQMAIWGDSHASALASGYASGLQGYDIVSYGIAGCLTSTLYHSRSTPVACAQKHEQAIASILSEDIDLIVIHSLWSDPKDTPEDIVGVGKTLQSAVRKFRDANMDVVILGSTPVFDRDVRSRYILKQKGVPTTRITLNRSGHMSRSKEIHDLLLQISKPDSGVTFIDPTNLFCGEDICTPIDNGKPLFFDKDHLNIRGAGLVADLIDRSIADTPIREKTDDPR
jgi:peptidoglycan/LPS O-acetylase OafA/YrhL